MKYRPEKFGVIAVLSILAVIAWTSSWIAPRHLSPPAHQTSAQELLRSTPLAFEPAANDATRFVARGPGFQIALDAGGTAVALGRGGKTNALVRTEFRGANRAPILRGVSLQAGKSHYLLGDNAAAWRRDVPRYDRVRYEALYPGVDLVFYGNPRSLEYDFVVAPGADPSAIRLGIAGTEHLALDVEGNLVMTVAGGKVVQQAPLSYQEVDGRRVGIPSRYTLMAKNEVGFELGSYDTSRPLVIDPVLSYSTFLGGTVDDIARGVATDSSGNSYVTGYTAALDFPATAGTLNPACPTCSTTNGYYRVFVTKYSPAGTVMYSTYVGTSNTSDKGYAIAVDSSGNAYVTGETYYPGSGTAFPVVGGYTVTAGGGFVFKLDATGSALLYSSIITSGSAAVGYGIAVDGSGGAYVAGMVVPSNASFPLWPTAGTYSSFIGSASPPTYQAFVMKVDTTTTGIASLVYATRFGGNGAGNANNYASGVAVDGSGNAYVTGYTGASNFPATVGIYGGGRDVFVSKFDPSGAAMLYSTYLGGSLDDEGNAIAIDASGNAYVTGYTSSTNFPTTATPFQTAAGGLMDVFVSKLDATGATLLYSTYLGGGSDEIAYGVAVDGSGNAYVGGYTYSTNFPVLNAIQSTRASANNDAFVAMLNPTASALVYSTYLGGTGNTGGGDKAYALAIDSSGNAFIAGQTDSADFPTQTPAQATKGTTFDAFVAKIAPSTGTTTNPPPSGGGTSGVTSDSSSGGGCFIATAAYGTPMAEDVRYLRAFRDEYLMTNTPGRAFVRAYYTLSPPVADFIREHEAVRAAVRVALTPFVAASKEVVSESGYAGTTADRP
ncbi:MAG: SBBP repeat-containing protein [Nitrosomonadales bacterium]|nr:SBBP repeat-containing protein [Nitrosomonadales bacterium]